MKFISKPIGNLKKLAVLMASLSTGVCCAATGSNGDIVAELLNGSIGKTLGKGSMLWTVLIAFTFAGAGFYAALKQDPKAFIPAFLIMGIITTVTGLFIGF